MKNLFTLCLITLSSSLLFSQGNISFGVFGGFNYSVPLGDGVEELKDDIEDDLDDYEDS